MPKNCTLTLISVDEIWDFKDVKIHIYEEQVQFAFPFWIICYYPKVCSELHQNTQGWR